MILEAMLLFALSDPMQDAVPKAQVPDVEAFSGDLTEGLARVAELALEDRYDESLALSESMLAATGLQRWIRKVHAEEKFYDPVVSFCEPTLDWLGLLGPPPEQRAEIHFARGVVLMRRGKHDADAQLREAADNEYQLARSLAGPGELRRDSVYNLGVGWLEEAERVRLEIPEIREKLGLPALPPTTPPGAGPPSGPSATPSAAPEEPPDPLEVAHGFYVSARKHFVERLQLDWHDKDTQANVELVQRRLRELDEIERQREQQEQEQSGESEQQEGEDSQSSEDQSKEEQSEEQEKSEQSEDQSGEQEPEPGEESKQEQEKPEPEEAEDGEELEQQPAAEEPAGDPEERVMTREEVMRLLDRLGELEKEYEKIQEQLRDKRRVPVKRDW